MFISLLLTSWLTFVEFNCENLFDWHHDEGKNDYEFLPDATRKWDSHRYWTKLNNIARAIIACGGEGEEWSLPDLVALAEVENDSVMNDLTHRSLLRNAGYEYVMTHSDDERGIDVALLYSPFAFRLLSHHSISVSPPERKHATRDILFASGLITTGDTLHVMVVHAPSRVNGVQSTRPYRLRVAERIIAAIDSVRQTGSGSHIIIAGDFNDYDSDSAIVRLSQHQLTHVSGGAKGIHGARGTYKHQGRWGSLDHIFVSDTLAKRLTECHIMDAPFLTEDDEKYGGKQPRRTYVGYRYHGGSSDHLPLVAKFH